MKACASVMRLAVIAAVWPACVKVNDFTYRDAASGPQDGDGDGGGSGSGSGEGARAYVSGNRTVGELPGLYKLEFSPLAFHYPDRLVVQSKQLLGPTAVSCAYEQGVGIMYAPGGSVTSVVTPGINVAALTTPTVSIDLAGPGVARVSLDWTASFANCAGMPRGRSLYTFFPDGRITRGDITVMEQSLTAADCDCGASGGNWEHSTYTAFDPTHFTTSGTPNTQGTPNGVPTAMGENVSTNKTVCMAGTDYQLALGYRLSNATRVRRVGSTSVAFFADMLPLVDPLMGNALESTTMYIDTDTSCTELRQRVAPFTEDFQIEISANGDTTPIGLGLDGMYGGENAASDKNGGFNPSGAPIVLKPFNGVSLPAFAIWLDLSATPTITSVTRSPASPRPVWYTVQPIEPNEYVLWFPDGLGADETITIEAQ